MQNILFILLKWSIESIVRLNHAINENDVSGNFLQKHSYYPTQYAVNIEHGTGRIYAFCFFGKYSFR